jgi:hypothetical protein
MTRSPSFFWSAIAALAAGVAWLTLGMESVARPHPERCRDVLLLVPWVLTLLVLVGIHRLQRERSGAVGTFSFALLAGTMLLVAVGQAAVVAGAASLTWLAFPLGLIGWTLGMVLFGIAIVRANMLPAWCGVAVALAELLVVATGVALSPLVPLSDYGSYSGALAHGVIWTAIGLALLGHPAARVEKTRSTQPYRLELGHEGEA